MLFRSPVNCAYSHLKKGKDWFNFWLCRLKLKALHRFTSTATAVEDITAIQNGKLGKGLKQFLTDEVLGKGKGKESLVVIDPHLGSSFFYAFVEIKFLILLII